MTRPTALAILVATVATIGCSASPDQGGPLVANDSHFENACAAPEVQLQSVETQAVSGSCCNGSTTVDQDIEESYAAIKTWCGAFGSTTWWGAITPDGTGLAFYGPSIAKKVCTQAIVNATKGTVVSTDPCSPPPGSPHITVAHCNGYPGSGCGSCIHGG